MSLFPFPPNGGRNTERWTVRKNSQRWRRMDGKRRSQQGRMKRWQPGETETEEPGSWRGRKLRKIERMRGGSSKRKADEMMDGECREVKRWWKTRRWREREWWIMGKKKIVAHHKKVNYWFSWRRNQPENITDAQSNDSSLLFYSKQASIAPAGRNAVKVQTVWCI